MATSSTTDRYVLCDPICWFNMFSVHMFSVCMLLSMLVTTSSMFEINMLVAIVVMLNILELIMELLPNYSTAAPLHKNLSLGVVAALIEASLEHSGWLRRRCRWRGKLLQDLRVRW